MADSSALDNIELVRTSFGASLSTGPQVLHFFAPKHLGDGQFYRPQMSNIVSLSQHQATRQAQVKAAEQRAQKALLKASAAYKELHRLKGE